MIAWLVSSNGRLVQTDLTLRRQGMARQSRNRRNVASKVARASRPCVSVTGDNFAGTHRRDACATTLPVKSSPNATISGDSTAKARRDGEQFSLSTNGGVWPSPATAMHERRRALANRMTAGFATLLRPGTGALRKSGKTSAPGEENCRCQNHFGMDDRGKGRLNVPTA
jgi:hypothetical protein